MSIFKESKKDYSTRPEYTVFRKDSEPEGQMKPDVEYDLGQPGAGFRVIDLNGNAVEGVKLESGVKYKLVLAVKADDSETAQVEFETNQALAARSCTWTGFTRLPKGLGPLGSWDICVFRER